MSIYKFYKTLFDKGEGACTSNDTYGTRVIDCDFVAGSFKTFFCINPLLIAEDKNATKTWHSPTLGRRADCNVTALRNFLLEFDKIDLEAQHALIQNSGIPYSTLVFSGGKSLHCIISLEVPLTSIEEYKTIARAIYKKLGGAKVVDTSNCNPSRFSRAPNALRDNGAIQKLIEVRERVPNEALMDWLGPIETRSELSTSQSLKRVLHKNTNYFLVFGAPIGAWNSALFNAACDMFRAGYDLDSVANICGDISGHLDSNDLKTIKSAKNATRTND